MPYLTHQGRFIKSRSFGRAMTAGKGPPGHDDAISKLSISQGGRRP
jgi:hypothetical protein